MTDEEWILAVRKCVTDAFTKITVEEIVSVFNASSLTMDILHKAYRQGDTPQQAFDKIKHFIDPIYE